MDFNGEMMLVVQYDLPTLRYRAPLPHVLCSIVSVFVSGGKSEACFSLALREKKRGHPYSLVPSRRLSVLGLYQVQYTKEKEGWGVRVGLGLLLQPKVKHVADYQTYYWGEYFYFRAFSYAGSS